MLSRTDRASATRQNIVDAARRLLAESEDGRVSVEAIANAAGVTRVTVYNQLGSRHGLLDAVFAELAERGGMDRLLELSANLPPWQGCRDVLLRTCRFWHAERAVLRRLTGLAVLDPELARIFDTREAWRRKQLGSVLDRLDAASLVTSELPRRTLVDGFVALTSFQAYDRMGGIAARPARAAEVMERMLGGLIGRP